MKTIHEITPERRIETGAAPVQCHGWEGPCESMNAKRRCQNTRYVDEEQNRVTLCDDCMKLNHAYWDDMWADYYSNCM
jgi:hypothetical protein